MFFIPLIIQVGGEGVGLYKIKRPASTVVETGVLRTALPIPWPVGEDQFGRSPIGPEV